MYPTVLAPLSSIWKGMFGTRALICCSLSHGHSCRNLMDTSKVAPPQFSNEYSELKFCARYGLI